MSHKGLTSDTILIIIRHPEKGEEANGKAVCEEIRKIISGKDSPLVTFHDATHMSSANAAYAAEFKELDKVVSDRLVEVVCATPGSIPRMMAHTVAMFSDKDWSIFKSLTDAVEYINTRGFSLTEQELARSATVSVKAR